MTTYYEPTQIRRVIKAEQAAYIEQAIIDAEFAVPTIEGSLDKTRSTTFYFTNMHTALLKFEELIKEGWSYDANFPALPQDRASTFTLTLRCPDELWETYKPLIAQRAENLYQRQIEEHNRNARKIALREEAIEKELQRQEAERLAELREEITAQYDAGASHHWPRGSRSSQ